MTADTPDSQAKDPHSPLRPVARRKTETTAADCPTYESHRARPARHWMRQERSRAQRHWPRSRQGPSCPGAHRSIQGPVPQPRADGPGVHISKSSPSPPCCTILAPFQCTTASGDTRPGTAPNGCGAQSERPTVSQLGITSWCPWSPPYVQGHAHQTMAPSLLCLSKQGSSGCLEMWACEA